MVAHSSAGMSLKILISATPSNFMERTSILGGNQRIRWLGKLSTKEQGR
jgi:hypothetical protein